MENRQTEPPLPPNTMNIKKKGKLFIKPAA
jgi:hypothetical protein